MAIGMKHWIGIVAGGALAVAIWALPPSGLELPQRRERAPEIGAHETLSSRASRLNATLQRLRWSDSLSARALATAVDGIAVGAPPSETLTPAGIAAWRDSLSAHARALEPRAEEMVLGSFLQLRDHGAMPGLPQYLIRNEEVYVGVRDGTPYCLEVEPGFLGASDADVAAVGGDGFRGCRMYARFGLAGPSIQGWLENGALAFGLRTSDDPNREAFKRYFWPVDAPLFGLQRALGFPSSLVVERCLAGRPSACQAAVLEEPLDHDPTPAYLVENSPLTFLVPRSVFETPFRDFDDYLFADLEADFGTEAFARFWTSQREVPEAFEDAFGVEMAGWLDGWVAEHVGTYRAGPSTPASSFWLSLLTLTALAGVAGGTALRRRVG